ncbi:MAG TPA: outer membrane beta-barrel protein [Steroidobacteraceae bacterium]|nr:outer membrane beta-barrel protein [Steroidobacteraceae bacterium]
MNKIITIASLSTLALAASVANARGYSDDSSRGDSFAPYVGGSIGRFVYDETGADTLYPGALMFRVGVPINEYFALEGRIGTGFSKSDGVFSQSDVTASVDRIAAGYAKLSLPVGPRFSFYGLAGIANTKLRWSQSGLADGTSSDTGFSYGVGGQVGMRRDTAFTFEWARLRDLTASQNTSGLLGNDATGDMFSIGVQVRL